MLSQSIVIDFFSCHSVFAIFRIKYYFIIFQIVQPDSSNDGVDTRNDDIIFTIRKLPPSPSSSARLESKEDNSSSANGKSKGQESHLGNAPSLVKNTLSKSKKSKKSQIFEILLYSNFSFSHMR